MIKLTDFIKLPTDNAKVKFNINPSNPEQKAWDLLLEDNIEWLNMNAYKTKAPHHNLNGAEYLISFAQYYPYGPNYYIFGGIYKITKIIPEVYDDLGYKLEPTDFYKDYIKRLIIKLEKPLGQTSNARWYSNIQESLNPEVYELAPSTKIGDFPGYNNVFLTHRDLQHIVKNDAPEWKQALSKVKGIYVITDTSNGKLYIGSASGNEGIWQRWSSYGNVNNLTGGNKAFEELKLEGKEKIIDNFTYSILEIFDTKTDVHYILDREVFWKKVFKTTQYGMNFN